jgi:hypothetical protein
MYNIVISDTGFVEVYYNGEEAEDSECALFEEELSGVEIEMDTFTINGTENIKKFVVTLNSLIKLMEEDKQLREEEEKDGI